MVYVIFSFFVVIVSRVFVTLDEESLIILCSIIWLDAAGGFFKSLLTAELEHKVSVIRDKFTWFLSLKKEFLQELLVFHASRKNIEQNLITFNLVFVNLVLMNSLVLFLTNTMLQQQYDLFMRVAHLGSYISYEQLVWKLSTDLVLVDYSNALMRGSDVMSFVNFESFLENDSFLLNHASTATVLKI